MPPMDHERPENLLESVQAWNIAESKKVYERPTGGARGGGPYAGGSYGTGPPLWTGKILPGQQCRHRCYPLGICTVDKWAEPRTAWSYDTNPQYLPAAPYEDDRPGLGVGAHGGRVAWHPVSVSERVGGETEPRLVRVRLPKEAPRNQFQSS
eukprot:CAMPEP_0114542076 /NCGR_PEP_ID=MMETSP0114-20121206/1647_1 /TAXON_ID=31324 /ORGANISM="Goniomonas sp, Strain m" /LENGTH=151 /DNA_ID=CAMNT_0001726359 /DNA_START=46 /DNA_END=501 /DNA_ORIENTATION=-